MDELAASAERILAAKEKYAFTRPEPELAGRPEDHAAARETACDAVVLYAGTHQPLQQDSFFCGPMDYRMTGAANAASYDFTLHMKNRFGAPGFTCSADPSADEIREITAEAGRHAAIVLGTCNAHLYRGQLALAASLAETGKPMTVIALRNPYDLLEISAQVTKAAVFDYMPNSLFAAEEFLLNGRAPGRMPVRM